MRIINFHGGPLDGTTSTVGRIINDTYDHAERVDGKLIVHRYKTTTNGVELDAQFKTTFGGGTDGED
jgi:hypothetical protein